MHPNDRQILNERLARLLAPMLGDRAVYDPGWRCRAGHVRLGPLLDGLEESRCREWDADRAATCRMPRQRDQFPKDFVKDGLLFDVFKRIGQERLIGLRITRIRQSEDRASMYWYEFDWEVCVTWFGDDYTKVHYLLEAALGEALAAALEGEVHDGE